MKPTNLLFSVLLILAGLSPAMVSGQTFTESKKTEKTFAAGPETTIEVDNKYGKIHVIPWQIDSVKFIAELMVSSNNLSRLQKTKNNIRFNFQSSAWYITATTDFGNAGNQIFAELKNISDNLIAGKNTIEINYTIYCPDHVNLSVINKFGDVYMDDISGRIKISLSNGDIRLNNIEGESQIEVNFGTGIINNLSDAHLSVAYSDLMIREAGKLDLTSKSSTVNIRKAGFLRVDSKRDKLFVTNAENFYGSGDFSRIWIENLTLQADASLKFGNLTIDKVNPGFKSMNFRSEYADMNIYFEKGADYHADLFYPEDAIVSFPSGIAEPEISTGKSSPSGLHASWKQGSGSDLPELRITALQKCYLNIYQK